MRKLLKKDSFKILVGICILAFTTVSQAFIVKDIKVNGLFKIKKETFIDGLSVRVGEEFNSSMSSKIIRELYQKEFFESIKIRTKGNTLIFDIVERKVIGNIKFYGNREVATDMFNQALKSSGLIKGRFYNQASLEAIEQSLKTQYALRGRKNVVIETKTEDLPRNRISIEIIIDEGDSSEIRNIQIIGNKHFPDKRIIDELPISTHGLFTYFTKSAEYSAEKVSHALEVLQNFYQDRGYAKVKVVSHNVGKNPVENHVRVSIKIDEGEIYTIKGSRFAGNLVVPQEVLLKHINLQEGDVYSKKKIVKIIEDLSEELNDRGYTFSVIDPQYEFDEKNKQIFVTFYINPGRPVYVRRIVFVGNHKTSDEVLRRELLQAEGSLLSTSKVKESIRKMRNLRYIQDVQQDIQQVVGTNNQVDMQFTVAESHIAEFQGQAGYSSSGFEIKLGLNHHNVFGNGRSAGINYKLDTYGQNISLDYYNPYFSESGIGQAMSVFYTRSSTERKTLISSGSASIYSMDTLGTSMRYDVPISNNTKFNVGFSLKENDLIVGSQLAQQLSNYAKNYGDKTTQLSFDVGVGYSDYDQYPFPNSGININLLGSINVPLRKYGRYYKLSSEVIAYIPLFKDFVLGLSGTVKYTDVYSSNERVPFFEFYRAGGTNYEGQVRGYETASLGPQDANGEAMGGNLLISGTAAIILPEPLRGKSWRSSIFFDIGNVYQTYKDINSTATGKYTGKVANRRLRYSVGTGVEWLTPFGPIRLSFALALNNHKDDKTSIPGLSFMSGF